MNTAIGDGYDLGWKLSWVFGGWADPALLDTDESERRPVAEHNLTRSADANGSIRDVADEIHVDLGGRIARAWLAIPTGCRSTLDLLGPGLTLLATGSGPPGVAAAAAAASRVLVTVRRVTDVIAGRGLGLRDDSVLLVRPDGVPVVMGGGQRGGWEASLSWSRTTGSMRPSCQRSLKFSRPIQS
jgi:hypothetical protein